MDFVSEALEALTGIAAAVAHEGRKAEALTVVARVLADPATRSETRQHAEQVRASIALTLPADQVSAIEAQVKVTPLIELAIV